jgi:CheY-like chemotaxis protein
MDTGIGMDEATLARIFEPFFTTKEDTKGTGLGLSTVWGIVQQHGGGLNVTSSPEEGSTFEVYLPVVSEVPVTPNTRAEHAAAGSGRIMYVDDEELISLLGKQALEAQGYAVETFTDSETALAAFAANPGHYDLLITDQAMPGLAGSELIRRIRALRNELPVILCTGYSEILNHETAQTLGIDELLAKPYDIDQLKLVVRQVLDSPA